VGEGGPFFFQNLVRASGREGRKHGIAMNRKRERWMKRAKRKGAGVVAPRRKCAEGREKGAPGRHRLKFKRSKRETSTRTKKTAMSVVSIEKKREV